MVGIKRCPSCDAPLRITANRCPRCESDVSISNEEVPVSDWLPPGASKPVEGYAVGAKASGTESSACACPKCGSISIHASKKGFGAGKGLAGGLLFGFLGVLAGFIGSKELDLRCMSCGHKWAP
jgi:predicted RNA-binding Zn-ribbon protein involved in translation (DUF1610 family)